MRESPGNVPPTGIDVGLNMLIKLDFKTERQDFLWFIKLILTF